MYKIDVFLTHLHWFRDLKRDETCRKDSAHMPTPWAGVLGKFEVPGRCLQNRRTISYVSHTTLYINVRCRSINTTSYVGYDIVRKHTILYVNIGCRMWRTISYTICTYDVVRTGRTMSYVCLDVRYRIRYVFKVTYDIVCQTYDIVCWDTILFGRTISYV